MFSLLLVLFTFLSLRLLPQVGGGEDQDDEAVARAGNGSPSDFDVPYDRRCPLYSSASDDEIACAVRGQSGGLMIQLSHDPMVRSVRRLAVPHITR